MGTAVLRDALARGAKVVWDPLDRPRLLVPPGLHDSITAHREAVKEVLRRAAIFRAQARTPGPCPLLVLPDCPEGGGCLSCGAGLPSGHRYRCALCALAVQLALQGIPCPENGAVEGVMRIRGPPGSLGRMKRPCTHTPRAWRSGRRGIPTAHEDQQQGGVN